jgi:hypothetical protein
MGNIHIHQIFYNSETKKSLDQGFIPLDNCDNTRSDWREYWPIRKYLINNRLNENDFYGFFSPKFKSKTGLSADDCFGFINSYSEDVDVFSFSPYFDVGTWFLNSFLQAASQHSNARVVIEESLRIINPALNIDRIVMHSGNNIFCNFFVAKPKFWREWLAICELIYREAEEVATPTSSGLNSAAERHHNAAPIKTFVIERVASLMLASNNSWKVRAYDPFKLPFAPTWISKERAALIQMDALKMAFAVQGRDEYIQLFHHIQDMVEKNHNKNSNI